MAKKNKSKNSNNNTNNNNTNSNNNTNNQFFLLMNLKSHFYNYLTYS